MPLRFNPNKDYYGTLLVPPTATREEITASWRRLAGAVHPDAHPGAEARATALLQAMNEAREVLTDPAARVAYDSARAAWLRTRQGGRPAPGPQSNTAPQSQHPASPRTWPIPWWIVILATLIFPLAGLLMAGMNLAMRNRSVVAQSSPRAHGPRSAGRRMSARAWWWLTFGGLFVAGGLLSGLAVPLAGAPAGSAGAVLAGPVTGLALMCDVSMVGIALVAAARLAARTWSGMDPGQRRTVLLGVGAWLLWRGFWREMRRARAG
jgi:hypothetical protein